MTPLVLALLYAAIALMHLLEYFSPLGKVGTGE